VAERATRRARTALVHNSMSGDGSGMAARVLLGNLEPVVALGMAVVLEEQGLEVIGSEPRPQPLVLLAGRLRPDAAVLDLHHRDSRELAGRVRAASPETTVVLWARDEDVMEVGSRRIASPTPDDLLEALRGRSIAAP
jgi:hypothetical protein